MIKVAQVIKGFDRGGAEMLLKEAFENQKFSTQDTESWLIILHQKHLGLLPEVNTANVRVFDLFSINFFLEYIKLYRFFKRGKFDIVHTHLAMAGIVMLSLKLFGMKMKVLYTEHSLPSNYHKIVYYLNGLLYHLYDRIILISPAVRENIDQQRTKFLYHYKGKMIYNGVNVNKFNIQTAGSRPQMVIGTIATMRREKRLDLWVGIAAALNAKYPGRLKFIIGGDGAEMQHVKMAISQRQLDGIIELPGNIIKTQDVYPLFDVFMMTSEFEGFPVALLEAMSCGCIPVATNVGGIKNVKFDNYGLKFDIANLQPVEDFIGNLLQEKDFTLQKNGVRRIVTENYSLDKQLKELLQEYEAVLCEY